MLNTAPMILEIRKRLLVSQKLNRGSTNMKTMHDLVVDVEYRTLQGIDIK